MKFILMMYLSMEVITNQTELKTLVISVPSALSWTQKKWTETAKMPFQFGVKMKCTHVSTNKMTMDMQSPVLLTQKKEHFLYSFK